MKNSSPRTGWLVALILLLGIGSCDIINPDETIPTTIHLEPFTFLTDPGQGSAMNKISEVWVTANGNILGAFAPPVDIRYLGEGPVTFRFYPGVRNNGIANDAIAYTFFTHDSLTIEAVPGAEHTVSPVTRYTEDAVFSFLCDFEDGNPFVVNKDTVAASSLVLTEEDIFEGNASGLMSMTPEADHIKVTHTLGMSDLPTDGRSAYLEMRYKSAVEFSIGLIGSNVQGLEGEDFFYLVKPTDEWNQLYLELTDRLVASDLPVYKIAFQALYLGAANDTVQNIYLDNIKVVHR